MFFATNVNSKNVSDADIVLNAYHFLRIALGSMKHDFFHKLLASLIVLVIPVSQFSPFINLLRHWKLMRDACTWRISVSNSFLPVFLSNSVCSLQKYGLYKDWFCRNVNPQNSLLWIFCDFFLLQIKWERTLLYSCIFI